MRTEHNRKQKKLSIERAIDFNGARWLFYTICHFLMLGFSAWPEYRVYVCKIPINVSLHNTWCHSVISFASRSIGTWREKKKRKTQYKFSIDDFRFAFHSNIRESLLCNMIVESKCSTTILTTRQSIEYCCFQHFCVLFETTQFDGRNIYAWNLIAFNEILTSMNEKRLISSVQTKTATSVSTVEARAKPAACLIWLWKEPYWSKAKQYFKIFEVHIDAHTHILVRCR